MRNLGQIGLVIVGIIYNIYILTYTLFICNASIHS